MAADNQGKMDMVRNTIKEAVKSRNNQTPAANYKLLDAQAFLMMKRVSDRIWTEQTGHRTPPGELGKFPEDDTESEEEKQEGEELDKLFPEA
jgi:hypothetical protein